MRKVQSAAPRYSPKINLISSFMASTPQVRKRNDRKIIEKLYSIKCQEMKLVVLDDQLQRFIDKIIVQLNTDTLNLQDMNLGKMCIPILNKLIGDIPNIRLSQNVIGDGVMNLQINMVSLSLSNCGIGPNGFVQLFKAVKQSTLYSLNVGNPQSNNRNRLGKSIKDLGVLLGQNKILAMLDISACGIYDVYHLNQGLIQNQTLIYLNIADNEIKEQINLVKTLEELNVRDNPINQNITSYTEQLRQDVCRIRNLNISGCKFQLIHLHQLLEHIERNGHLQILKLDNNMLIGDFVLCIANYLVYNNVLEELSMKNCSLSNLFIQQLAIGMSKNSRLKVLNLSKNMFGNEGAILLADGFGGVSNLRSISVRRCGFNDDGGIRLFKQFLKSKIQEFDVSRNLLTDSTAMYAIQLAIKNRQITKLKFTNNLNSYETQSKIERLIKENVEQYKTGLVPTLIGQVQRMSNYQDEQVMVEQRQANIRVKREILSQEYYTAQSQQFTTISSQKDRTAQQEDKLAIIKDELMKVTQQGLGLDKKNWQILYQMDEQITQITEQIKSENQIISSIQKNLSAEQQKKKNLQQSYKQSLENIKLQYDMISRKLRQAEAEYTSLQRQMQFQNTPATKKK
ncbi:Leucine-rich repeat-containing protein 74A [Paramecium bursaria]